MKRYIMLLSFTMASFASIQAEERDIFYNPKSASQELWTDRTQLSSGFKHTKRPFWNAQTIQPLYRDPSLVNTLFTQGEFGFQKWAHPMLSVGLGYRHIALCNKYMLGTNLFFDHDWKKSKTNMGFGAELFGTFFTLRLNYNFRVHHHDASPQIFERSFARPETYGTLDFNFQLPYLPWTTFKIGPTWTFKHAETKARHDWRYALRMNICGPFAIETGCSKGFHRGGYICFSVNFGRPAVVEHSLLDNGLYALEPFTPRNLKNYTLEPVARFGYVR